MHQNESQFAVPRADLIGRAIAYTDPCRGEIQGTVLDAGNQTGGADYHIILDNGLHFSRNTGPDWRFVDGLQPIC